MFISEKDEILRARLMDAARLADARNYAHFVGFLDEREASLAAKLLRAENVQSCLFWGGHEDAERVMLGVFPDYLEPDASAFPIAAVTVLYRPCDVLTHRDFLGSLMALGINRDTVGDILVGEGKTVIFLKEELSDYLTSQISKIGKTGVQIKEGALTPLPQGRGFTEFRAVIASARLDCAVAAAIGTSREKAAELIRSGAVLLNHEETVSVSDEVGDGDKLSVRGKGRFLLDKVGPPTKKGRLSLLGRKYI